MTLLLFFSRREVIMEDLGENTPVLSTLRSLNNFISQRVEGGSGLDVSTSAQGSLQMQYQQSMQVSGMCWGRGPQVQTSALRYD